MKNTSKKRNVYSRTNRSKLALVICFLLFHQLMYAQIPFDNNYKEVDDHEIVVAKGKSIITEDCEKIVTVNSIENQNGFYDFQISRIDAITGTVISSFSYGKPMSNDYCNAISKSITEPDNYVLCGKSGNGNILVMEVKNTGTIVWSKTFKFGNKTSEALQIFPLDIPFPSSHDKGYLIIGNLIDSLGHSSIATLRTNEEGERLAALDYYMPTTSYLSNVATDATLFYDGIHDRLRCAITGNHITSSTTKVFSMYIDAYSCDYVYNHSLYQGTIGGVPVQSMNPQIVADYNGGNVLDDIIIAFDQPSTISPTPNRLTTVFRINPFASGIQWAEYFTGPSTGSSTVVFSTVKDIIPLNNNSFVLLGSEHKCFGCYNPFTLNFLGNGNFLSQTSFIIDGQYQYTNPSSIVENCEEMLVHNGRRNAQFLDHLKLTQSNLSNDGMQCTETSEWDVISNEVIEASVQVKTDTGITENLYLVNTTVLEHAIFDCQDEPFLFRPDKEEAIDENGNALSTNSTVALPWFSPNPASNQLQLGIADETATFVLYNSLGKQVLTINNTGATTIDISKLSKGMYFLEKINSFGTTKREKLIIH